MINKQVFSKHDPLRAFKEKANKKFPNCAFFTSPVNSTIDIGSGYIGENAVTESIITDGSISLQKKNFSKPLVIWENHLLTLENGTSISIEIENASFMIHVVNYLGQTQVDIHVSEEEKALLQNILDFFYRKRTSRYAASSVTFTSPSILVLESLVKGEVKQETFDFSSGDIKEKRYGRKYRGRRYKKDFIN